MWTHTKMCLVWRQRGCWTEVLVEFPKWSWKDNKHKTVNNNVKKAVICVIPIMMNTEFHPMLDQVVPDNSTLQQRTAPYQVRTSLFEQSERSELLKITFKSLKSLIWSFKENSTKMARCRLWTSFFDFPIFSDCLMVNFL